MVRTLSAFGDLLNESVMTMDDAHVEECMADLLFFFGLGVLAMSKLAHMIRPHVELFGELPVLMAMMSEEKFEHSFMMLSLMLCDELRVKPLRQAMRP